jgi:hypothetical protein
VSSAYQSADLILKLYDLRRETKMREARDWYFREFNPASIDEVMQAMMGPNSAHFRMVTSYWDMAASFVANGAIDEKMFNDATGEQVGIFAKIEPFVGEFRAKMGNPALLVHLEAAVLKRPGAKEMMASLRERFRTMAANR